MKGSTQQPFCLRQNCRAGIERVKINTLDGRPIQPIDGRAQKGRQPLERDLKSRVNSGLFGDNSLVWFHTPRSTPVLVKSSGPRP